MKDPAAVVTYYATLEVPENASPDEIKSEYRKLALEYHPDRLAHLPGHRVRLDAEEKLKEINEAYAVLSSVSKRAEYDRKLLAFRSATTARPTHTSTKSPPPRKTAAPRTAPPPPPPPSSTPSSWSPPPPAPVVAATGTKTASKVIGWLLLIVVAVLTAGALLQRQAKLVPLIPQGAESIKPGPGAPTGSWRGSIHDQAGGVHRIQLEFTSVPAYHARAIYQGFKCEGSWTLVRQSKASWQFAEELIDEGGICQRLGTIQFDTVDGVGELKASRLDGDMAWSGAVMKGPSRAQPPVPFVDELNEATFGVPFGIRYARTPTGRGASFTRERESRIEYPQVTDQGTLEWSLKIDRGYAYSNFSLDSSVDRALLFTTDCGNGDVTWPGSAWLWLGSDGQLLFNLATEARQSPPAIARKASTAFRFGEWHTVGLSYGSNGIVLMLDGRVVAHEKQAVRLGAGGHHQGPVDVPTIGESVSGFWRNNQHDAGFEGTIDRLAISPKEMDWQLASAASETGSSETTVGDDSGGAGKGLPVSVPTELIRSPATEIVEPSTLTASAAASTPFKLDESRLIFDRGLLSAQVDKTLARFTIPLGSRTQFVWNSTETPWNSLEYAWTATVAHSGRLFEFGFSLFHFPDEPMGKGQFEELMRRGQVTLFDNSEAVKGAKIFVTRDGPVVVIAITDGLTLRRLFAARPQSVTLTRRVLGERVVSEQIPITYRER